MIGPALAVAAATLAAGVALALLAARIRSLRGRVMALALVAVVLPLAAVVASGVLMFDSGHDLTVLAAASASATAALVGALLVARSVLEPVGRVRRASEALALGDLTARAPESGPAELAELGATFNRMASELERLFDARRELVAHASHDLRTPLASLQAMLEAVEDGLAPPEQYLPAMGDQVRHLARLVRRPLRAGAHRRRSAHPRAARGAARRPGRRLRAWGGRERRGAGRAGRVAR